MAATEHRLGFHESLDRVRDDIVRLGAMAIESVAAGTAALLERNLGAAQAVIDNDDSIDILTIELEDTCVGLLALQNPVAGDLRFILSSMRIAAELERSADLMVNVAKTSRRILDVTIDSAVRGLIDDMSIEAGSITRKAIDAYVTGDAALAAALDDIDDRLDELQHDFIEQVFTAHSRGHVSVRSAVQLALIGRYYERIGDHAVNIGERVMYQVSGWLPEHAAVARRGMRPVSASDASRADSVSDDSDATPSDG